MNELNIYQRVNKVMSECDYLKKKQIQAGKGVPYDEVIAMLRELLISNGIVMRVNQDSLEHVSTLKNKDGSDGNQKTYQGRYTLDLINIDNPEDIMTHSVVSHGMDGGDKAPGKAHTYAMKIMLVKAFAIETGEDDESRAEKQEKKNVISDEQYGQLAEYCVDKDHGGWTATGNAVMKAFNVNGVQNLPASKFDEALTRAISHKKKQEAAHANNK